MIEINSEIEFVQSLNANRKSAFILYKTGSESCDCAISAISDLHSEDFDNLQFFKIDVQKVNSIHAQYDITTVPTLLIFDGNKLINAVKGCMSTEYYQDILSNEFLGSKPKSERSQPKVTVYSTDTCPWCTKLKDYLKEKNIRFADVNVGNDSRRMEEMKRKSGQMGVPQSDIGGTMVVGFDKTKINQLLGIN